VRHEDLTAILRRIIAARDAAPKARGIPTELQFAINAAKIALEADNDASIEVTCLICGGLDHVEPFCAQRTGEKP
jgi:hypothetical protein